MRMSLPLSLALLLLPATSHAGAADPFQYADLGDGWYTHPSSDEQLEPGRDGHVDLYLFASGNFVAEVEEHTPSCVGVPGECRYDVPVRFWAEGRWSEDGGVIRLSGFGSAQIDGTQLVITMSDARATEAARNHRYTARATRKTMGAYGLRMQQEYYGHRTTIPEVRDAQPRR